MAITAVKVRARPTTQARSRDTLDRLLASAEEVLGERGLEGTTVPEIARRAGLSVGAVYRRFPDKDALLRAVYEAYFARAGELNRASLLSLGWSGAGLAEGVRRTVSTMVWGAWEHRLLLRALLTYAYTHPDPAFRREAEATSAAALAGAEPILLRHRDEIPHTDPEAAVRFALFAAVSTLRAAVLADPGDLPPAALDPDALSAQLGSLCLGYLGVYDGQ
ncbi:MAG: TetR/AcrR family transcriptional regulator [Gemmatimonadetes bacterium]|nr:TetR/AcrR family transcriptional regulator [Gemmatimonadota bacterium]